MKKALIYIVLAIGIVACGTKETVKETTVSTETKPVSAETKPVLAPEAKIEFSDPARMGGSNFGAFFISMIRTQNFDMALKFTSKGSIEKFGAEKIKEYYQTENFRGCFNLLLVSKTEENGVITLKFTANEFATNRFKEMKVVVENDSCKLILPDNMSDLLK